jgi:glycosyltransferase involved in cell wall biosynthesis
MIDILIPTYNRAPFLIKNIILLNEQMESDGIIDKFRILVSNNCSTDDTKTALELVEKDIKVKLKTYEQFSNIGLEKNAIFLLCESDAEFIIYLGDDDYLPSGYLNFIAETIENDKEVTAIIPGILALYPDGLTLPGRFANFEVKKYSPSLKTTREVSNFGHQLSGLFLKRDGLSKNYLRSENLRNIYPFIFFVAYNNLRGTTYYAPKFQVLVSQGNSKDWKYDDSGLLVDILKNFKILYPDSWRKRLLLSWSFIIKQSWRLRIGSNPIPAFKSFIHLVKSKDVDLIFKHTLIFAYVYFYVRITGSYLKKFIFKIK